MNTKDYYILNIKGKTVFDGEKAIADARNDEKIICPIVNLKKYTNLVLVKAEDLDYVLTNYPNAFDADANTNEIKTVQDDFNELKEYILKDTIGIYGMLNIEDLPDEELELDHNKLAHEVIDGMEKYFKSIDANEMVNILNNDGGYFTIMERDYGRLETAV